MRMKREASIQYYSQVSYFVNSFQNHTFSFEFVSQKGVRFLVYVNASIFGDIERGLLSSHQRTLEFRLVSRLVISSSLVMASYNLKSSA